jgi:hypothetical protein
MASLEELDEAGDDTTFNDTLDGRILLLGQKLAEFRSGVKLTFWIF